MVSIIVAKSTNNAIGFDNQIPWKLPEDLKRFKEITMNSTVIMGRKTYESIGRPLPGRINIVISRNLNQFKEDNIMLVDSLDKAILKSPSNKPIFIIGGEQIYKQALDKGIVDCVYITNVEMDVEGDAFFPELSEKDFVLREKTDRMTNSSNEINFLYEIYDKKSIPIQVTI